MGNTALAFSEFGSSAGRSMGGCRVGRALIAQKVEKEKIFWIKAASKCPAAASLRGNSHGLAEDNGLIGTWFGNR